MRRCSAGTGELRWAWLHGAGGAGAGTHRRIVPDSPEWWELKACESCWVLGACGERSKWRVTAVLTLTSRLAGPSLTDRRGAGLGVPLARRALTLAPIDSGAGAGVFPFSDLELGRCTRAVSDARSLGCSCSAASAFSSEQVRRNQPHGFG